MRFIVLLIEIYITIDIYFTFESCFGMSDYIRPKELVTTMSVSVKCLFSIQKKSKQRN